MDDLDRASAQETREREAAIAARPKRQLGNGVCVECLDAVEPLRITAIRCLSCQQDEERRQRIATGRGHV